jgi:signal transduction histidine kinase
VRVGLRGRLVAVLATVSALSLAVAALALLPPLEHRLRADALENLRGALRDDRATLARLPAGAAAPHSPRLERATRALRRDTGAEIGVLAADGALLASTDPDAREPSAAARDAVRSDRAAQLVADDGASAEAQVALPAVVGGTPVILAARKPLTDVQGAARVVRRAFTAAAAAGLAGALLVGLLLAGRLASRIRRMRDTALRVAEIGPVAELEPERGHDEIADLSRAFATMQERLREQEQARRAFVATASHELRTPLSSLRLLLDMLKDDLDADPVAVEDARALARRADEQADRLSSLAAELLDLSRVDAGVPLRAEPVDLCAIVRSVVAELQVRLAEEHRHIDAPDGRAPTPQWAIGDPGGVAQVVRILLDNALRHTAPRDPVGVAVCERGGRLEVVVHDGGPGVASEDRERIFERFARGAHADAGGFGLGLAIGRELARRMDGDLVLDDTAAGARFVLVLPSAGAHGP